MQLLNSEFTEFYKVAIILVESFMNAVATMVFQSSDTGLYEEASTCMR